MDDSESHKILILIKIQSSKAATRTTNIIRDSQEQFLYAINILYLNNTSIILSTRLSHDGNWKILVDKCLEVKHQMFSV